MSKLTEIIRAFSKTGEDQGSVQGKPPADSVNGSSVRIRSLPNTPIDSLQEAKVTEVLHGDTAVLIASGQQIKVRLACIDCPEEGQPWGDTARDGLSELIAGKRVRIETHGLDRSDKILATIFLRDQADSEWVNVNERMVNLGHAWVMRNYYGHLPSDRRSKLNSLEQWARSEKIGLWQTKYPTAPWRWRHNL